MSTVVPVRFQRLGASPVPTVDFSLRAPEGDWLTDSALVDTGSAFTMVSAAFLRKHRVPVEAARELPGGAELIGGTTRTWFLEAIVFALADREHEPHFTNLPRLYFTQETHVPILGRDALRRFNAILTIDFNAEDGHVAIG